MIGRIPDQIGFGNTNVRDSAAIIAPCRAMVGAGIPCNLTHSPCLCVALRGDDPDIVIVITVGLVGPVAAERYLAAIGAPGRLSIVKITECQLQRFCIALAYHIQMITAAIQVGHSVPLELQPVDYKWQRFCFFASLLRCLLGQVGCGLVFDNKQHFLAIGRP